MKQTVLSAARGLALGHRVRGAGKAVAADRQRQTADRRPPTADWRLPTAGRRRVFFFDLDNTLHDASHAIFNTIDARMTDYVVRHLEVDVPAANQLRLTYWRRYGATMLGLLRHHAVDPHHFLRETHDFDVTDLLRAERGLERLFSHLRGRKVLLTNAPDNYAAAVLRALDLHRKMGARYAIEHMRVFGEFRPKPSVSMLRHLLAREKLAGRHNAGRAVLIEDSPINLKAARAAGFRTVLVTRHWPGGFGGRRARPQFVDLRLRSVRDLPRALRFMR
ncbi:MAG TPA: HAD-IA family hydrolase [Burkholderiaceae bacterium]|nr:HAD-IA family hydrolase [Burkholderiaceae bacterium]